MIKYTIKNINAILLSFAVFDILVWLIMMTIDPFALWTILFGFLIIITIDRYKEVKYER